MRPRQGRHGHSERGPSSRRRIRSIPTTGEVLATSIRRSASAGRLPLHVISTTKSAAPAGTSMKPFAFENNIQVDLSTGQDISDKARSYTQTQFQLGHDGNGGGADPRRHAGYRLQRREHRQSALSLRAVGRRHRHGELSRGPNERRGLCKGRRARARPLAFAGGLRWEEFQQASLPIDTLEYDVSVGQCALVPCDEAALQSIMFEEDDVYPALATDAHLPRRSGPRTSRSASV